MNPSVNTFLPRIEKLKNWSRTIAKSAIESDYFQSLPENYLGPAGLTKEDLEEKINRIAQCANRLYIQKVDGEKPVLIDADFCRLNSVCPVCASRVSRIRKKRLEKAIKKAAKDHPFSYMITLTIRNRDNRTWADQLEAIKTAFRSFMRAGQLRYKKAYGKAIKGNDYPKNEIGIDDDYYACDKLNTIWIKKKGIWQNPKQLYSDCESRKFKAGFYAVELKVGEGSGLPHVHLHMIVFTDEMINTELYDKSLKEQLQKNYVSWDLVPDEIKMKAALYPFKVYNVEKEKPEIAKLSKFALQWYSATESQGYITDVKLMNRIPKFKKGSEWKADRFRSMTYAESIFEQCDEVLKYTSKLDQNSGNDVVQILDETPGQRTFATFGEFYGLIKDDYREEINLDKGEVYSYGFNSETQGQYRQEGPVTDLIKREHDIRFHKKIYLGKQARMLSIYKGKRKAVFYAAIHRKTDNAAKILNQVKADFRSHLKQLWERFKSEVLQLRDPGACGGNPLMLNNHAFVMDDSYSICF